MSSKKQLVGPTPPMSRNKKIGLIKSYREGQKSPERKLGEAMDIDYLSKLEGKDREFMANFLLSDNLLELQDGQSYDRKRGRAHNAYRRDIYNKIPKTNLIDKRTVDSQPFLDGVDVDDIVDIGHNPRGKSRRRANYTLKDYLPSKQFYPDLILRKVDSERAALLGIMKELFPELRKGSGK